jgi:hypothetical protein
MEAKIVNFNDAKECVTHLFEGESIMHQTLYFNKKSEFLEKYNSLTKGMEGHILHVPEEMWKENTEEIEGCFLHIRYEKNECLYYIIVMKSRVYITCKGHTVDTVIV